MEDILLAIGKICVNFETLDLALSATIGRLVTEDAKIIAIITAELPFSALVHTFSSLTKYRYANNPEFLKELEKLTIELSQIGEKRNAVIHSSYYMHEKNNSETLGSLKVNSKQKHGLKIIDKGPIVWMI